MTQNSQPTRVGLVGCGYISSVYLKNCSLLPNVDVVACADLLPERARGTAEALEIPRACSVEELLADPDVEVILNLTVPAAHAEVTLQALEAGKHVYSEKPLAIELTDACRIMDLAADRGLLVGCAPDTVLGAGYQTCRALLDREAIGQPVAASAFFMSRGQEEWHPEPHFFYQHGAGPLFDMGPYRLTALITLLGPVARVSCSARISFPQRRITSSRHYGELIKVTTPTHVVGILEFASGPLGSFTSSFDAWPHHLPEVEIYGSEGSLRCPDPDGFRGPALLRRADWPDWQPVDCDSPYRDNWRGLGLADMARAIREGGAFRANAQIAYHVLDVMHALYESAESGRHVDIQSTCERPEPFLVNLTMSGSNPVPAASSWLKSQVS